MKTNQIWKKENIFSLSCWRSSSIEHDCWLTQKLDLGNKNLLAPTPFLERHILPTVPLVEPFQGHSLERVMWHWDHIDQIHDWTLLRLLYKETQEMWVRSLGWEDPLKQERGTCPSILAWKIPWREEPGGLQSMELQRVRQDWACMHINFQVSSWVDAEIYSSCGHPSPVFCVSPLDY